jgi:O-antigen ligase
VIIFKNSLPKENSDKVGFFLLCFIPISFISGSALVEINFLFLFFHFLWKKKKLNIDKDIYIFLILFWLYIVFVSIIGYNFYQSASRSLGFVRVIIYFYIISSYYFSQEYYRIVIKFWGFILFITCFDILFQYSFGFNTLGFEPVGGRLGGFMNQELKIGNFIFYFSCIYLSLFCYKNTRLYLGASFFFLIAVFLTGERANFLSFFIFLFISSLFLKINFKKIIIIYCIIFFIFIGFISLDRSYSQRYLNLFNLAGIIPNSEKLLNYYNKKFAPDGANELYRFPISPDRLQNSPWSSLAYNGIEMFKDNLWTGVGLKNFRLLCNKYNKSSDEGCSTHPHNFYVEMLSELGLIGLIFILFIFFLFFKKYFLFNKTTKDQPLYFFLIFLTVYLVPLIPKGSFFTNWTQFLFWFVVANFYGHYIKVSKKEK